MASVSVKATYSLDVATVRGLDTVARRWNVSKSEALRRAIRAAVSQSQTGALPSPEQALEALQKSAHLAPGDVEIWARSARASRSASARRRETRSK